jgi:hypothetical protein
VLDWGLLAPAVCLPSVSVMPTYEAFTIEFLPLLRRGAARAPCRLRCQKLCRAVVWVRALHAELFAPQTPLAAACGEATCACAQWGMPGKPLQLRPARREAGNLQQKCTAARGRSGAAYGRVASPWRAAALSFLLFRPSPPSPRPCLFWVADSAARLGEAMPPRRRACRRASARGGAASRRAAGPGRACLR